MIARLLHLFATLSPERAQEHGKASYFAAPVRAEVDGAAAV